MNKEIYDIDKDNLKPPTFKDCEDNSQKLYNQKNYKRIVKDIKNYKEDEDKLDVNYYDNYSNYNRFK